MGIANGAEFDILSYLISRYYGVKHFGGVFGAILAVSTVAVGCGPLLAAWVIEHAGGYDRLLLIIAPFFAASAVMMIGLPRLNGAAEPAA
jgi:MFS family permease